MEDDADDVDADAQDYAAMLKELGNDDGDWEGETGLGKGIFYAHSSYRLFSEGYQTLIDDEETLDYDVFIIFKKTLMSLESSSQQFYNALTSSLTPDFKQVMRSYLG